MVDEPIFWSFIVSAFGKTFIRNIFAFSTKIQNFSLGSYEYCSWNATRSRFNILYCQSIAKSVSTYDRYWLLLSSSLSCLFQTFQTFPISFFLRMNLKARHLVLHMEMQIHPSVSVLNGLNFVNGENFWNISIICSKHILHVSIVHSNAHSYDKPLENATAWNWIKIKSILFICFLKWMGQVTVENAIKKEAFLKVAWYT